MQVAHLSTVWTVLYTRPSRYNWMFQFYLRDAGLALSWVGSGRLIFSLNYSDAEFDQVVHGVVAAAQAMQADGWWWEAPGASNRTIRRGLLKELIARRLGLVSGSPRGSTSGLATGPAAGTAAPCDRA